MDQKKEENTLYYEDKIDEKDEYKDMNIAEKEHILVNTNGVEYDPDDYESKMLEEKNHKRILIVVTVIVVITLVISLIVLLH